MADDWASILEAQAIPPDALSVTEIVEDKDFLTAAEGLELARAYFLDGNLKRCAELQGVRYAVALRASHEIWFQEEVNALDREARIAQKARITKLLDKSMDELEDRLDKGDVMVTRDGDQIRRPITARDAAMIASVLYEKRAAIESDPNIKTSAPARKLLGIAERLRQNALTVDDAKEAVYSANGSPSQTTPAPDGSTV